MDRATTTQILMAGALLALVMIAADVTAQTGALPSIKGGQTHAAAGGNAACQRILNECKRLGFIQGQWKQDNGLWKDCFDPIVKGNGTPTRDGKPISVPVSPGDVQACRAAQGHHR